MKYKIDLTGNMLKLNGEENQPVSTYAKGLAGVLESKMGTPNAIKIGCIAMELYKSGVLELDKADFDMLRALVDADNNLVTWFKFRILELFDNKVEIE